ncbi:hypothetical protein K4K56_012181 [Colletotrichum sp. SAR 10_98]|nr:hypothetical protein K4K56_012181 [Colletotrichum sp. SAR 10_98]
MVPDQGRAQIESRKNLTRNDLRKAVTSAAEMMGTDPEKSSTAARIILDALLWDSIQKFDRYDDDIVLAKEYLIISYFNTGDFAKAEDLSRQVLAARMAKRPPVAMLVRAARQKLTQVLVKIGTQNRKDGKEQEANQIMALQKTGNNEGFNSLNRITLERRQLMRTYVLELKDKAQGGKVYDETQRGIEAFQLASRIQKNEPKFVLFDATPTPTNKYAISSQTALKVLEIFAN